jgi:hypothetical protein
MLSRVVGATLRATYYAVRGLRGGEEGERYRSMTPLLWSSLRTLVALATGRR